jgi:DsbC/DsbD-like thiol-disulfide interchange protein
MLLRLATLAVFAALGGYAAGAYALEVLTVLPHSDVEVKPRANTQIVLQVVVKPGYHVQANPVENPSLIPITLTIDGTDDISVGPPLYPTAKRLRLAGDSQDLVVYDGTFGIAVPLKVGRNATNGARIMLKGSLRYQACDDSHCLFPVTLPVTLPVKVAEH